MPAAQKSNPFLVPSPQFVKKGAGRIVINSETIIILGKQCRGNEIIEGLIQDGINGKLGLKIRVASANELAAEPANSRIYLDCLPADSSKAGLYDLQSEDYRALADSYGQGYVIKTDVTLRRVCLVGAGVIGLMYALVTLKQLLQKCQGKWVFPAIYIRDYPDFKYRVLDWLLNAEVNRWAYDWGDGRQKFVARIKRRLDICLAYKINMIRFDGFGWDSDRFPGYAGLMQEFNAYARARGIMLIFGGYGGGYGFVYQKQFKKQGKYFGKVFVNRHVYPEGEPYQCAGNPFYEKPGVQTRIFGTCLSNKKLRDLKIAELAEFVRRIEPGAVLVHDMDTGDYKSTTEMWKMRCAACRRKWPNDNIEAQDGLRGAYTDWFKQLRRELSLVNNPGGYKGEDCCLMFAGPLYGEDKDPDKTWKAEIQYFKNISAQLPPDGNWLFAVREQMLESKNRYRVAQLNNALSLKKQGVILDCVSGGDLYLNDHLFAPMASIAKVFKGAKALSFFNGHVHQEAQQVFDANYLWNANAPGSDELPTDQNMAFKKFHDFQNGKIRPKYVFKKNGLLDNICDMLFGKKSGRHMSALYRLKSADGYGPVTVVWFPITRRLWNGEELFDKKCFNEWRQRLAVNEKAIVLVEKARKDLEGDLGEDVEWLLRCLKVSGKLLNILVKYNLSQISSPKTAEQKFLKDSNEFKTFLNNNFSFNFTDPLGGDGGTWLPAVELLEKQFKKSF